MDQKIILDIRNVSKEFPGVKALNNVNFSVRKGEVHALCGENGAGKSTLIKILGGIYQCDEGCIWLNGKEVKINSPLEGQKMGISIVHQELKLAENLSVAENIFLGRPKEKTVFGLKCIDWKMLHTEGEKILDSLGLKIDQRENVSNLSLARKQMVEIAKALSFQSDIIIMDEPSATLTDKELAVLFDTIRLLKANNVTIIYISHRLDEIFTIADRVTVLRDGNYIGTVDVAGTTKKQLIKMMVGRELENEYPKVEHVTKEEILKVSSLNIKNVLKDINFRVFKGEILGIGGLVGSGRTELARAIFGADRLDSGEIYIRSKRSNIKKVKDAIKLHIALVPEDRKQQGLVLGMSVRENISLVGIREVIRKGFIRRKKENEIAKNFISRLKIATPDVEREVKNLSGGNQQKVVLAKWLMVDSDIIIFDEPTRGIDVGAKVEIYYLLNQLVSKGKAVIMISSEMPELLGMCDRILVMREGAIAGELKRGEANQELIMQYAIS